MELSFEEPVGPLPGSKKLELFPCEQLIPLISAHDAGGMVKRPKKEITR